MSIRWLDREELGDRSALRRQVVLTEPGPAHVPAFREVFVEHFGIRARALPEEPGWFRGPTGNHYELVLTARAGEEVPAGLEVAALPDRFTPLSETAVDRDVWAFLRWVVERAGTPWTLEALDRIARLYRTPESGDTADGGSPPQ